MTGVIQRVENGLLALAILLGMLAFEQPWWLLFAAFLVFDLSALGYLAGLRVGGIVYNAVHNYSGPAMGAAAWFAVFLATGSDAVWIALLAACWAFHVAVDRALGYGLKEQDFTHTHLGPIGRAARASRDASARRRTYIAQDTRRTTASI
ncbi:DUF4260 family protein [Microbacterium sp. ET2]|uniref:DUF4260 family protein n=1 Tax=Microbacterium albipurpureum TaxID=3050384 RepID=UPI00259C7B47|nr:DUF4260 family protein [Microbacterium sp. ET2 (Ac-2212)]WJL96615.1 DUF4260 family protein [Microbacterium sp. ET2 (Ac-2212)]